MDAQERLSDMKIREFGEYGGVNPSIEVSTTFTVLDPATLNDIFQGHRGPQQGCYLYGRSFNPTVKALGRHLAALENVEAAYVCSSGMAAISSAILALCNTGDHVVCSSAVYGGTFALFKSFLPLKCNIHTTFVPIEDLKAVEEAITERTKVIYTETLSNPTLVVADLPRLAHLAHSRGIKLVVDNTFTPLMVTPSKHGADVILHSMTKYMSGASDIVAGAVCGSTDFIQGLMNLNTGPLMLLGPTMDPKVASELLLRLPHLALRMQEHSHRAMHMAEGLQRLGAKVTYPGLSSHPGHQLLQDLSNEGVGFGGLMGVELQSTAAANAFMQRLQNKHGFGFMAVSLGYFDTLMSLSASSTSSELSAEEQAAAHIPKAYVRISVGISGTLTQRWSQLQECYEFVQQFGANARYRAVKVKHTANGHKEPMLTWPSEGSDSEGLEEEPEESLGEVLQAQSQGRAPSVGLESGSDEITNEKGLLPDAPRPRAGVTRRRSSSELRNGRKRLRLETTMHGEPIEVIYERQS